MNIPLFEEPEEVPTKTCLYCNVPKPHEDFPLHSHSKDGYDSRCTKCIRSHSALRRELRKTAPPKPIICECCGQPPKKWCLDHDHERNVFRGWLCDDCNTAIGALGDTYTGVLNALQYIVAHEHKHGNIKADSIALLNKLGDILKTNHPEA